jgi:nuclease S1
MVLAMPRAMFVLASNRWRGFAAILIFQLFAFAGGNPAFAWGNVAHRAIAAVAEQHLTPETAKEVRRLLALEGASQLVEIVMWADQIRRQEIPGTPDHDVGIPLDAEGYDAARDCQTRCIVGAIPFYLEILADRSKSDRDRLEALKYVAHLVGDIHQPLHASQDGGGQMVVWDNKTVYLHILWDVTMLAGTYPNPDLLASVITPRFQPLPACGRPEQWANESHHIAKTFVFSALGADHRPPIKISNEYFSKALPMIEERVTLAAMRLSCVLNDALDRPGMSRR